MNRYVGLLLASTLAFPSIAYGQETLKLTIASSHPTTIPWIGMIQTHFMPGVDRILGESGQYKIEWQEAFGGQLYKADMLRQLAARGDAIRARGGVHRARDGSPQGLNTRRNLSGPRRNEVAAP